MLTATIIDPECLKAFDQLKKRKIKYIIYKLDDTCSSIVVDRQEQEGDYESFISNFKPTACGYGVFDFEYPVDNNEGIRNKICFFAWCPDIASMKNRMVYAVNKEILLSKFYGHIGFDLHANCESDLDYEKVLDRLKSKTH